MPPEPAPIHGRGATLNPANRFQLLHYEPDDSCEGRDSRTTIRTQYFRDDSHSVISYNDSPDLDFDASLNPYRGCEHGCAYCYARPTHEYLGLSAGLDFESRILVKPRAPELLRTELMRPSWKPQCLVLSGVTDAYQPIEKKLGITRDCLRVLADFRNPAFIVTKNHLVTRDSDYLGELAGVNAAGVAISITTLDHQLARLLEPRASIPSYRLEAIATLHKAGIPVGVNAAPIIPGLNEHEIPNILKAAAAAGAQFSAYTIVRLPLAVAPIFVAWLETHFPDRKEKILGRIRSMRDGKLNSSNFGKRMHGDGPVAEEIRQLFRVSCRRFFLDRGHVKLSAGAFRRITKDQPELF